MENYIGKSLFFSTMFLKCMRPLTENSHSIALLRSKGSSDVHHCRMLPNYSGMNFWARGYFVSTVGANEDVVRAYIREQEQEDHRVEQLNLFK